MALVLILIHSPIVRTGITKQYCLVISRERRVGIVARGQGRVVACGAIENGRMRAEFLFEE